MGQGRPMATVPVQAEQNERRIKGKRAKGADGHPNGAAIVGKGCYNGHSGSETTQRLAERNGIKGHGGGSCSEGWGGKPDRTRGRTEHLSVVIVQGQALFPLENQGKALY
ncbi:hypothetical protein ROR02_05990 [Pararhodospirillum oryzae]|uniref:Uncharacterized protein n=1 Tax=Pararhodospirillum oryzae TaxID=478448 RepID=A0A512H4W7_9PROT|nr:hypothetical protein ROR02_05990 [Pararhodospirillum oryzae]